MYMMLLTFYCRMSQSSLFFFCPKAAWRLVCNCTCTWLLSLARGRSEEIFIWGLFEPWRLKSTMISIIAVWIVYIFRLMWTFFEINSSDFILFVDREFIYLFTWSRITIYLFRLNSWTFGGVRVFVRHWSINIYFYSHRCPNFWIANFSIVFRLLIILLALRIWFKN